MANTVISLKKSGTPSAIPVDLANGELAINYADGKIFYKSAAGSIQEISGGGGGNSFGTVNANGTLIVADTPGDVLTLIPGSGITITGDAINDTITISSVADVSSPFNAANAAFDKANAANLLAFNTGIGANAFTSATIAGANTAVGAGANAFTSATIAGANTAVGAGANAYANLVWSRSNTFASAVGTSANAFASATIAGANTVVGAGANSYATTVGTSANAFASATIAGANVISIAAFNEANLAETIAIAGFNQANAANVLAFNTGIGANAFTSATIAGANTAVGAGANAFTSATISGANTAVGAGANAYANLVWSRSNSFTSATIAGANAAVGTGANAFTSATIAGANTAIGAGANAFASATIAGANTAVGTGANNYSNATFVRLTATSQTITGDLTIVGNLSFSGNTTFSNVTTLRVNDPLIYLAGNNYSSDVVDIGFIGNYVNATGANVHTGLYREHTDKMYYLFQGYDAEPVNNHIGALSNNMTLAVLNADLRTSNLALGGQNTIIWIRSAYDQANAANVLAFNTGIGANAFTSATIAGANTAVGAGANAFASSVGVAANAFASATIAGANTAVGAGANAFASSVGVAANAFASATIAGANTAVGAGANAFASATIAGANTAVGAGANAYANLVWSRSNTFASTVGTSANAFASATIAGANTAVGAGANAFTSATIAGANTAVGAGANAYANLVWSRSNSFTSSTIAGANTAVGTGANAFTSATVSGANTIAIAAFNKANSTLYTSNVVISVADNTNAALRITQTGTGNALVVEDEANPDSTSFIVDTSGNVLVGTTTNPNASRLHLSAGGNSRMLQLTGTDVDSSAGLGLTNDAAEWNFAVRGDTSDAVILRNITAGVDAVTVTTGGNVGIANTNPNQKLTVQGAAVVLGATTLNQTSAASFDWFPSANSARILSWGSAGVSGNISFWTGQGGSGTIEYMRITGGGNIGIRRTDPGVALDVVGTVNASAVLVNGVAVGGGGLSLVDQTASATVHYPTLTTATTGSISGANTSSTKLSFVPSTGTLSATIFNSTSDENYKKDINTLKYALDTTAELRGVSFKWKDNDQPSIGLIAQEVEKVVPEVVMTIDDKKTLNYDAIIGLLVESIKELKARVEKLENNG